MITATVVNTNQSKSNSLHRAVLNQIPSRNSPSAYIVNQHTPPPPPRTHTPYTRAHTESGCSHALHALRRSYARVWQCKHRRTPQNGPAPRVAPPQRACSQGSLSRGARWGQQHLQGALEGDVRGRPAHEAYEVVVLLRRVGVERNVADKLGVPAADRQGPQNYAENKPASIGREERGRARRASEGGRGWGDAF